MKKLIKFTITIMSIFLCVTIAFTLPMQVYAVTLSEHYKTIIQDYVVNESQQSKDYYITGNIIGEDTNKRNESIKQFRLDNGSYLAASYNVPIHFKDKQGNWIDFDNTLVDGAEASKTRDNVTSEEYINKQSNTDVIYSKTTKNNSLVKLQTNNYSVSWGYNDTQIVSATIVNHDESLNNNEKYTVLTDLTSELLYENIYNNVDIQYITTTVGIKENIILKNANAQNEFDIHYDIDSLTAKEINGKEIMINDNAGKTVCTISAPYMIDANGKTSDQLSLMITEQKDRNLSVKLVADEIFLSNCEYPVTIDPTFTTNQDWQQSHCTYANSSNPNTAYGYGSIYGYTGTVYVGTFGQGMYRSYLKMNSLPELNKGDMIVNATVNLHLYQNSFYDNMDVGAYFITENWAQDTLTWNNKPNYESNVIDYERFIANDPDTWHDWDVTSCVKRWYNGDTNNGIMLKSLDEDNELQCASFYSSNYPSSSIPRPLFRIEYRSNKGLENYWTYSSFSVGTAGTAYINDYSGNLVFISGDAATASGKGNAFVQHVFNNYMSGDDDDDFTKPYEGKGWRLNIEERIALSSAYGLSGEAAQSYPYVFTDSDGTEHYFYKKTENNTTKYLDEDGLGLELTLQNNSTSERFTISDDNNNKTVFYSSGRLNYKQDSNGNRITVNYSGSTIVSVKDGSNNLIQIAENSNNQLTSITDPANRTTTYNYTNERLKKIIRPNNTEIVFNYDTDGSISSITDVDGYKVTFTYTSSTSGKKVQEIQEYGTNNTPGQRITFDRTKYNTTVISTYGADGIANTNDDLTSTYQFDESGRTISIKSKTRNMDLGAANYKYTPSVKDSTASNIKMLNRVNKNYSTGSNPVNLISNGNMENNSAWIPSAWCGSNSFTPGYDSNKKYFGSRSLYINSTGYNGDSRARVYQDISNTILIPGKTYTLSGYVLTQGVSGTSTNSGAFICADCFNSNGSSNTYHSDYVIGNTSAEVDNGWQRISLTFTVPQNTTSTRINLALRAATGTVFFDGIQLEQYAVANNVNLLENAGFENGSTGWTGEYNNLNSSTDKVTTSNKYSGSNSFTIKGSSDYAKGIKQTVNICGTEEDTYIVSGWAKANAVPSNGDSRKFKISVKITYTDDSTAWQESAVFNHSVSDWQFSSAAFTLSDGNASTQKTAKFITVCPRYQYQENYVYFDNLCLEKDNAQSYTYDSNGNLISVVDHSKQQSTMEYSNSDLIRNTDLKGYSYTYDYDDNHNLTKATSQTGVNYNYTYDSNGLATELNINASDNSKTIKTTASYNNNGLLSEARDADNALTTYNYNNATGTLTSYTDSKGNTTNYSYDPNTNSTTEISKTIDNDEYTVNYSYSDEGKYLETISHNNTDYNIEYDEFGNKTNSKVGSQSLASYNYNANNGSKISYTYGTGQTIGYSYGAYGNMSSQRYNGNTAFSWETNRGGDVVKETDYINSITYGYTVDTTGRLVHQSAINGTAAASGNRTWYSVDYGYDLNNNVTRYALKTLYRSNVNLYEYGQDNLPTKLTISQGRDVTYQYDTLNRLTGISLSTITPITHSYTYCDSARGSGFTTTKLASESINGTIYKYVYDSLGNITEIRNSSNNTLYRYVYDGMSQLISDTDFVNFKKHSYDYDTAGNILSETISDIDQNENESNPVTKYYAYGDSNWKDKMTSYNGQTITYDAIGNPLTYRDGITMTWKNGRELASLQNSDNTISYNYGSSGIRVSKTVNGTDYKYAYLNGKLVYETRGTAHFFYSYDSSGILYSVKYTLNDSAQVMTYYFTHNSRGDIIGIYNGEGSLKARYEYDAWGNVISITDQNGNAITSSTHIGNLNPFRYRGYYYDSETGLYYLMSRYYDPVIHRFINADGYFQSGGDILDANMSVYCANNPINFYDPTGTRECPVHHEYWDPTCKICRPDYAKALEKRLNNASTAIINASKFDTFLSEEYRVGGVPQESNGYPIGFYTKSGGYYVNDYTSSAISFYYSNYNEIGLNILSISLFAGVDDLGVQVGLPFDDTTQSLEASFSFEDFCLRIGWDKTTYNGDGVFEEVGAGFEVNGFTLIACALTIFGAINSVPVNAY